MTWAPIMNWHDAMDSYIPTPERASGQTLPDARGRRVSISAAAPWPPVALSAASSRSAKKSKSSVSKTPQNHLHRRGNVPQAARPGRAGDNVGYPARGTKREDVGAARCLCKPNSIKPHTHFTAEVYV